MKFRGSQLWRLLSRLNIDWKGKLRETVTFYSEPDKSVAGLMFLLTQRLPSYPAQQREAAALPCCLRSATPDF